MLCVVSVTAGYLCTLRGPNSRAGANCPAAIMNSTSQPMRQAEIKTTRHLFQLVWVDSLTRMVIKSANFVFSAAHVNMARVVKTDKQSINQTMRWRFKRINTSLSRVPTLPGLYAFGHDDRACHGLTANRVYVYIGETDNLKRRLGQHLPSNETNSGLRDYLRHNPLSTCWFCPMEGQSARTRKKLESELIQYFRPKYNSVGK